MQCQPCHSGHSAGWCPRCRRCYWTASDQNLYDQCLLSWSLSNDLGAFMTPGYAMPGVSMLLGQTAPKKPRWKIFDHFSLYIWTRTSKKEKQIENGWKYRFQITNKNNSTQGTEQSARMFEHKQINRRLGGRRQETHKLMKLFFSSHSQKSDPETTFVFFLMCEYNLMGESFFPPNLRLL